MVVEVVIDNRAVCTLHGQPRFPSRRRSVWFPTTCGDVRDMPFHLPPALPLLLGKRNTDYFRAENKHMVKHKVGLHSSRLV